MPSIMINVLKDELDRNKRMLSAQEKAGNKIVCEQIKLEIEMIERMILLAETEFPQMM